MLKGFISMGVLVFITFAVALTSLVISLYAVSVVRVEKPEPVPTVVPTAAVSVSPTVLPTASPSASPLNKNKVPLRQVTEAPVVSVSPTQ